MATTTIRPIDDLSNTGAQASTGTDLYAMVDEVTLDTGDYVEGLTTGTGWSIQFEWTNLSLASSTTINSITVYVVGTYIIASFSLNGVDSDQIGTVGTGTPTLISKEYTTNPFTSSPWTPAEVNDIQAYIMATAEDAKQDVTMHQTYIVVDYTEGKTGNFFLLFDF